MATTTAADGVSPAWSPDGEWIAFYRVLAGERDIWILPAGGGTPVRINREVMAADLKIGIGCVTAHPNTGFSGGGKITPGDIAIFSRQLATMLAAGIPLVQAFEIVGTGQFEFYIYAGFTSAPVGGEIAELEALSAALTDELPPVPVVNGGELRESFPSSQTHIYVGQSGMARHDPDYYPLYVGNHVLGGGGLVSTLGDEVREKRGLTYGIGTYLVDYDYADMILGQVASANEVVGEAKDGSDAVALYKDLKPDLVTMDITMRGMDGFTAAREILDYDREARIIFLSNLDEAEYGENARQLGAKGYLNKHRSKEILELINQL